MGMVKGAKVYVVEDCLIEEKIAAFCAGEVGLAVLFECRVDSARVHVINGTDALWEIPPSAVCTVPEGHLSDLYREPCPACGLQFFIPPQVSPRTGAKDVLRPYRPPIDPQGLANTLENLKGMDAHKFPGVGDDYRDHVNRGEEEHDAT
jgi:hypothetical protein